VYDSIEGYRNAHERADGQALKTAFASRIDQREATLAQINAVLAEQDAPRVTSGSALGTFHDIWGRVLSALGKNDHAIASHIEEGEEFLQDRFKDALKDKGLPLIEREVIARAFKEISEGASFAEELERVTQ
jgi:uncharacterized protein (TIGR02284 family)